MFKSTARMGVRPRISLTATLLAGSAIAACPLAAQDQSADVSSGDEGDEIVVEGFRAVVQNSIDEKRNSVEVYDALSADEIGDIPALSIGEALETLTGAGSHRENGGATEISIRGLGPFLGSTVINGRVATNGSGDRSVNFSQFPAELFTEIGIYKTQAASYIEGGVAGQIVLETTRPIDYGKRRVQGEIKAELNPDNYDIDSDQRLNDFGYRGSVSYVDQFAVGDGEFGISLGYERRDSNNPEQEMAVSNTIQACVVDPSTTSDGVFDDGNCDTSGSTIDGLRDGSVNLPFVIARNSYSVRQNITADERNAFFAAVQYQPSPNVDINADFQYSKRTQREQRSDLNFAEGRRIDPEGAINAIPGYSLSFTETGALREFTSEQRIEAVSEYLERNEEYYGGGLSVDFQPVDRLTVSIDASYSRTQRLEQAVQIRFRTEDDENIFGETGAFTPSVENDGSTQDDRVETAIQIFQNGSQGLNFVVQDFDVNDYTLFANDPRLRADLEQDRFNEIWAVRGDVAYEMDGFFSQFLAGTRYQQLVYKDVPGAVNGTSRFENTYNDTSTTGALALANQECRTSFPQSGFLSSVTGDNALFTQVDSSGNVVASGNTFATFDALCVARVLEREDPSGLSFDADGIPIYPSGDFDSVQNTDVEERTWAGYVQADFDGTLASTPVRGNVGVRVINTSVRSNGFRSAFNVVQQDADGDGTSGFVLVEDTANLVRGRTDTSYTEFLPSFNLVAEFNPDLLGRFAVYRALSRPDPSSLGDGRIFSFSDDDEFLTVQDAIANGFNSVSATGNPATEPLLSWNFDAGLEWYPDDDTILAFNAYYKSFNGGFETVGTFQDYNINGQDLSLFTTTIQTSNETSTIYGLEVTAAHRFSYLPAPLDGLGFKVSYNYSDSDFEFEDDTLGEISTVNPDGSTSVQNGLIVPSNLFGFSEHVLSAQAYYEIGPFDFQGIYKYRSEYFQQFVSTPGRIRYVDDVEVFEARVTFKVNDNLRISAEGLNLFNEPRTDFRGAPDDLGQVLVYGPRYFVGLRARF